MAAYKQSRNGMGHLVVHRVPIFVECKRGETDYDADWIKKAVQCAKQAELEGYHPPLHIRHHGDGEPVQSAGFFTITGAAPITFKGETRTAIYADLTITAPWVEDDLLKARLPYRSVEIFNVDVPEINSLALLDHEPPYLQLPLMMIAEPDPADLVGADDGAPQHAFRRVANATFDNPWHAEARKAAGPVVACFRRGQSAHILLQDQDDEPMAAKKIPNTPAKAAKPAAKFADDEGKKGGDDKGGEGGDDKKGEEMEGEGSLDISAVVKAIGDGSISVADMEEIKAAIIAQQSAVGAEEEPPAAAPASTPGEAMKKTPEAAAQFAALQGKIDAQDAKIAAMENDKNREKAIADALARLDGRPLGANPEEKFGKFFDAHGAEAFAAYVDEYESTFATLSGNANSKAEAFSADNSNAPEVALAYTEQGTEAVTKAASFAAEHKTLAGRVRMNEKAYVEFNMTRVGFKAPKAAAAS